MCRDTGSPTRPHKTSRARSTLDSFYQWYDCTVRKDEYLIPGYVRFETANRGKEIAAIFAFPDGEKLALAGGLSRVERNKLVSMVCHQALNEFDGFSIQHEFYN